MQAPSRHRLYDSVKFQMYILVVSCKLKRDGADSNEYVRDAMQEIANGGLKKVWGMV
jgi:hypothetical protein